MEKIKDLMHFANDEEKMVDFKILTKEEFLSSYSYLTEEEYDLTVEYLKNNNMEDFYERIAEYDALVIEANDFTVQDMDKGIIKINNNVFDDFVENAVIYIYCADINADVAMECVMRAQDDDGIVMELLDCFNV